MAEKITQEQIEAFIDGHDPQERIVNLMYDYDDTFVRVIYRNENDKKCEYREDFYPFCWATRMACERLCHGDREQVKKLLGRYGIGVKKLSQTDVDGNVRHEFNDGYLFMFYAKSPMSYRTFLQFFKDADNPVYNNKKDNTQQSSKAESRQYLCVTPQEQFMISTGKRFFKGYDDYDQILRMTFDLETTGLNTEKDRIIQKGVRINRPFPGYPNGFEKIINIDGDTEEEKDKCELWAIEQMLKMIQAFQPDVITAHNCENFDWNMIIGACKRLGVDFEEFSAKYFRGKGIKKEDRDTVLKLGGEIEYYKATIIPGIIVTDSLHAVRRAQALDSNMLKADLKYVTEYSEMKKPNRVYIPGKLISTVEKDLDEHYAFNDENGDWYIYDPTAKNCGEETVKGKKNYIPRRNTIMEGYELKSGQYIGERYLLDDLWECDKVEHRYNTPNFLVCKMIPVPYKKCTTMGTAGQWKSLMMAWSYEQGLAIPMFGESKRFTGGLSRLLRVGFVDNVIKLDFNSLYPSIILTWGITDPIDLMHAMLYFLEHVLTQREKYKGLKKKAGKAAGKIKDRLQKRDYATKEEGRQLNAEMLQLKADESFNDKKQLPLKIFGNSFFGSYGAPDVFPWGSLKCAEQVTCTGRQCLRLMISHFKKLGYEPIVGDSFMPDTPVLIKYDKTQYIDIVPIEFLIDESQIEADALGREYDYSEKPYTVLCRSGWVKPNYIYRHKTDKDIYEVIDGDTRIEVTEDHSLFNAEQQKIKPSEIDDNTKLEYFTDDEKINSNVVANIKPIPDDIVKHWAKMIVDGKLRIIPSFVLNSAEQAKFLYNWFMLNYRDDIEYSKTVLAGLMYIKKRFSPKIDSGRTF